MGGKWDGKKEWGRMIKGGSTWEKENGEACGEKGKYLRKGWKEGIEKDKGEMQERKRLEKRAVRGSIKRPFLLV